MMRSALLLLLLLTGFGASARAEDALVLEETFLGVEIKGQSARLESLVVKEVGAKGRLPIAIITHGQPAEEQRREEIEARSYQRLAREFA